MPDTLQRFLFEDLDIRGELVSLDQSWNAVIERHQYPANVRQQLGEALGAISLLCATLKFEGSLILQIQGAGPLRTLVAQATHQGEIRGLARWEGEVPDGNLDEVFGEGQLVLTARTPGSDPHQSIVSLQGDTLSDALAHYFRDSEQLRSAFWLFVSEHKVAGLFLQQLPSRNFDEEDWQRVAALAATITEGEMLALDNEAILHRLFHEETVKLFPPGDINFHCTCSAEKIENSLYSMGMQAMQEIIETEGAVKVDCEFCKQHYHFNPDDIERLFTIRDNGGTNIVH